MSEDLDNWLERPTCDARTERGRCGAVLYADGECPIARSHVTDVELPEYDEEAAMRLLAAIEDPIVHEILRWEAEGGG